VSIFSTKSAKRSTYQWLLFAATLAAVTWYVVRNLKQISHHPIALESPLLVLSFLSVLSAYLVKFGAWTRLASMMDLKAPWLMAARAYFLSTLGRYIPGKVGLALIRVEAYRGYPADRIIMATGIELIVALTSALLLAFIGLATSRANFPPFLRWAPLIAIIPLLIALSPPLLRRTADAILRLAGRKKLDRLPPYKAIILFVLAYMLPGFLHGLGLFLLLNMLSHVPGSQYLAVTGIYYAANLIGLVAVFAPGGLGVREGILFLVLPILVGKETAIVAAILIRLITIAAEITLAGAFAAAAAPRR
jgi:uncharacterized membrane protein YbhN (UPF0104 family)